MLVGASALPRDEVVGRVQRSRREREVGEEVVLVVLLDGTHGGGEREAGARHGQVEAHLAPEPAPAVPTGPCDDGVPQRPARAAASVPGEHRDLAPAEVEVLLQRQLELGDPDDLSCVDRLEPGARPVGAGRGGDDLEGGVRRQQGVGPVGADRPLADVVPGPAGGGVGRVQLSDLHRAMGPQAVAPGK